MSRIDPDPRADHQLREVWALVAELGRLTDRLRKAADEAAKALGLPDEEEGPS